MLIYLALIDLNYYLATSPPCIREFWNFRFAKVGARIVAAMNKRFSSEELYELRTHLRFEFVIEGLEIPSKVSEGYLRFLCPCCNEFQTAINRKTNLGRCFRCERNFNTIELVIADRKLSFVDSVQLLKQLAGTAPALSEPPPHYKALQATSTPDIS